MIYRWAVRISAISTDLGYLCDHVTYFLLSHFPVPEQRESVVEIEGLVTFSEQRESVVEIEDLVTSLSLSKGSLWWRLKV